MERSIEEIRKEGNDIAKKLGNGVRYAGPQMAEGKLEYHLFNDDAVTDGSFSAVSLEEAKEKFIAERISFNAPLPNFETSSIQ